MKHDPSEFLGGYLISCVGLADIVILAELAAQVTPRKENRTRSMPASQGIFLPMMRSKTADPGTRSRLADPQFALQAVHSAGLCT